MAINNLLNVKEAAEVIGCTTSRVRQLLIVGELEGMKANERAWLVSRKSAERMRDTTASTGRPRNSKKMA